MAWSDPLLLEWTFSSTSLVTPEGAQEHVGVCAVWMLKRRGHREAAQGEPMNLQNLKGVKSMKFYGNQLKSIDDLNRIINGFNTLIQ